jgi:hypothetical protein
MRGGLRGDLPLDPLPEVQGRAFYEGQISAD